MNHGEALTLITASAAFPVGHLYAAGQKNSPQNIPATSLLNPRQFGAIGDGTTFDSPAINAAIDACNKAGGGVVYCSPGKYLCGTVVLKSNVTLFRSRGSQFRQHRCEAIYAEGWT